MGDAHGWDSNGRQVFDPVRLEEAAAELRRNNTASSLTGQLQDALLPAETFGRIPGGAAAHARLSSMLESLLGELDSVGIDLSDLASRALAASQLAREVDPVTRAAARRAQMY